ncbi:MAG TPA: phosphoribosyltransferase family protein [Dictyobacter sp.]|jgi:orotate phosphoribosyltransferase|nr:phosphoribosyltransferase family protein [Dictyobacter sp.]
MMNKLKFHFDAADSALFADAVREVQPIVYAPHADAVAKALVKSGSFSLGLHLSPEKWFKWKCGIVAPCGCNCRYLNGLPEVRRVIDRALVRAVRSAFPDADYIIAVANAGIPWAKTIAESLRLPLAYVRSEPKMMGKGHLVECSPVRGEHAIVVEDVVVSGKSTRETIDAIHHETNIHVAGVQSIVNWNFQAMRRSLAGYAVSALTSYPFILACALQEALLEEEGYRQLMSFYRNPYVHVWAKYYAQDIPSYDS